MESIEGRSVRKESPGARGDRVQGKQSGKEVATEVRGQGGVKDEKRGEQRAKLGQWQSLLP